MPLHRKGQVHEKTPTSIFIETLSQNTEQWFYPCAEPRPCAGTVEARANGQCSCSVRTVVYPVGIMDLELHLEHSYETTIHSHHSGSSNNKRLQDRDKWLDTTVDFGNGTLKQFQPAGSLQTITMPVRDWLGGAAFTDLDTLNTEVQADYRDPTNFPTYRTTGLTVLVDISYTNKKCDQNYYNCDAQMFPFNEDVNAVAARLSAPTADAWPTDRGPTAAQPRRTDHRPHPPPRASQFVPR